MSDLLPDEDRLREFDVTISSTLYKDTTVYSSNWEEYKDEDGYPSVSIDSVNFVREYELEHYTPVELLKRCSELIKEYIDTNSITLDKVSLRYILYECKGWIENETEVIPN